MAHDQLQTIDLVIIGAYLIALVLIGVHFMKKVKNIGDYYIAGRTFGPIVMMATVCATIIGGSGLMGRAGVAYSDGFKAVMTALPYLLGMFIFSGISGRISAIGFQHNVSSMPDLFERRFGKTAKIILGAMIAFTMMGTVASQVTATATIISMLGGEIGLSYEVGALIACIVFMIYTATSGLFGVVYTDVVQFFMLLIFVYILIPIASLYTVGGFSNFTANLDPALAKPYIDGDILGDIVTYLVFTLAGAEMWQRAFAAKDGKSAKRGMFLGTLVYGVTIFLVFFMGVIAHQIIGDDILAQYGSTDATVPALAITVLPVGLTGLALAGILSVIMSTADSYLLVSVQTCVHDIVKTFKPGLREKNEIRLSRIFCNRPSSGCFGNRFVHKKCLFHSDVCLELLCGCGGIACLCGAILAEGDKSWYYCRHGQRLCSLRRLEAGGTAIWTGRDCSRCHCLRCRVSMREPGHLQNTTVRISGGFKK